MRHIGSFVVKQVEEVEITDTPEFLARGWSADSGLGVDLESASKAPIVRADSPQGVHQRVHSGSPLPKPQKLPGRPSFTPAAAFQFAAPQPQLSAHGGSQRSEVAVDRSALGQARDSKLQRKRGSFFRRKGRGRPRQNSAPEEPSDTDGGSAPEQGQRRSRAAASQGATPSPVQRSSPSTPQQPDAEEELTGFDGLLDNDDAGVRYDGGKHQPRPAGAAGSGLMHRHYSTGAEEADGEPENDDSSAGEEQEAEEAIFASYGEVKPVRRVGSSLDSPRRGSRLRNSMSASDRPAGASLPAKTQSAAVHREPAYAQVHRSQAAEARAVNNVHSHSPPARDNLAQMARDVQPFDWDHLHSDYALLSEPAAAVVPPPLPERRKKSANAERQIGSHSFHGLSQREEASSQSQRRGRRLQKPADLSRDTASGSESPSVSPSRQNRGPLLSRLRRALNRQPPNSGETADPPLMGEGPFNSESAGDEDSDAELAAEREFFEMLQREAEQRQGQDSAERLEVDGLLPGQQPVRKSYVDYAVMP